MGEDGDGRRRRRRRHKGQSGGNDTAEDKMPCDGQLKAGGRELQSEA